MNPVHPLHRRPVRAQSFLFRHSQLSIRSPRYVLTEPRLVIRAPLAVTEVAQPLRQTSRWHRKAAVKPACRGWKEPASRFHVSKIIIICQRKLTALCSPEHLHIPASVVPVRSNPLANHRGKPLQEFRRKLPGCILRGVHPVKISILAGSRVRHNHVLQSPINAHRAVVPIHVRRGRHPTTPRGAGVVRTWTDPQSLVTRLMQFVHHV